ncbi:MAG: hypothetical protein P1V51_03585 [Deltaproteobacteria bacterium]|nr:hypothetical protein [Deltaproteobacteria bacterium]
MRRSRSLRAFAAALSLAAALPASARVGFGDPSEAWREREPGQTVALEGHLRLRAASFLDLDLDRPAGPATSLWPAGEGALDHTAGADLRARLRPSFFLGGFGRLVLELDLVDLALGARPTGTPFGDRTGLVAATAFQEPAVGIELRSAYGEVILPVGILAAGRMPSHFGLGIAANAGDDLDDDGGDRSDRVAFVLPLFGHFLAAGYDLGASGPQVSAAGVAPAAGLPSTRVQSVSLAAVRFHAPWETDLYRQKGRPLLNYGLALSHTWQARDLPAYYQTLEAPTSIPPELTVERGARTFVADLWVRATFGALRLELEAVATHFRIDNASPWPGVTLRQPVQGNPFGAVLQVAWEPPEGRFDLVAEVGLASADPAPGFPLASPTAFGGGRPGDVSGSQLDGSRDTRMDAFRFHPAYAVDLVLWRTLLGGVSEAAYGRTRLRFRPGSAVELEANLVYSHGLSAASNPGGVAPLGLELDLGAELTFDHFAARLSWGGLAALGGLGTRGEPAPPFAQVFLLRFSYAL